METLQAIFQQLGVDASILPQFTITILMFFLLKFVFFKHLQSIIETRVEKTVKLESSADKEFEKINNLAADYKSKIDSANKDSLQTISKSKMEIANKYDADYKAKEKEVNDYIEVQRTKVVGEIESKRSELFSNVSELSNLLVKKITKG